MKEFIQWKIRNMKLLNELYQEVKADITIDFDTFARKIHTNIPIYTKHEQLVSR